MTFMDKSLKGEVLDIEQFIADWHEGRTGAGMELHASLGMTWEEYRQWLEMPAILPALLVARNGAKMSPKLGKPYHLPSPIDRSTKALESTAQLFGRTWTDSALCLPWADRSGLERFAVLSPSYCGDVLICSFRDGWWHEALAVFITGVTHWRLAGENEQEFLLDPAQWPEQGVMGFGLAEQRWHWLHIDGSIEIIY